MTGPRIHHLSVERTARVVTLGGRDENDRGPFEAWVVCHGYRQLAERFVRRFSGIAAEGRLVVAPEGLSRFYVDPSSGRHGPESRVGATWMTREDREAEIADYVRYLDRVADSFTSRASRRVALGFSQGVHTVARWAALGNTTIDRLVLWGAYLPPDLDLVEHRQRLAGLEIVQIHGETDRSRSADLQRAQEERLSEAGIEVRTLHHLGGHEIDRELLASLV